MKKFIILGLVVLFVLLSAQGLFKVNKPARFSSWVKIGGDFIPIWDGRSNLGHSSYWFDSSFVEHGWFNYIQIDSGGYLKLDSLDITTLTIDDDLYVADTSFLGGAVICSTIVKIIDDLWVVDSTFCGDALVCSSTAKITGDLTVNGETNLGNAATDTVLALGDIIATGNGTNDTTKIDSTGIYTTGDLTAGDTIKLYKTLKFTNDGANSPASGDPMIWTSYTSLIFGGFNFEWKNLSGTSLMELNSANTNILEIKGPINHETYVIRKHVALSGATDDAATNFFTITTTDETGSADGGMYSVKVHLTAGEATAAEGAVNTASVSLIAHWTRIMASAGTGANSAIVEISESSSADEGSGAISVVTLTVAETSEFVQQVSLLVNTSGGTFDGFALVELVYSDFTTAPVIQ